MSEPHQRTRSGKLHKARRRGSTSPELQRSTPVPADKPGIANFTIGTCIDPDDEYAMHMQTPTLLCRTRINILTKMAMGYNAQCRDPVNDSWRNVWRLGVWHIGNDVTVSVDIMQPNVAGAWVNLRSVDTKAIQSIADEYNALKLPSSTCRVTISGSDAQVQGRWSLDLADRAVDERLVSEENVTIAGLNVCQSSIVMWVMIGDTSQYCCSMTSESLKILTRYIPQWCCDIHEVSVSGSISLKVRGAENDATQILVGSTGAVQYQGTPRYLSRLPEALSTAICATIESVHCQMFMDSLVYKRYDTD